MPRGPALIKSVRIGQRWRRKSTSRVYFVYQVWRKDRMLKLVPLRGAPSEGAIIGVGELRKQYEPVDMYIDPEVDSGKTEEG